MIWRLSAVVLATFLINLPMGWWRAGVRKFSPLWFVTVHAAIPLVVLMRLKSEIGFAWYTYPPMILGYFGGQFLGARLRKNRTQTSGSAVAPEADSVV